MKPLAMIFLHEKLKKLNILWVIVVNLWKPGSALFRHLLVVLVLPLSQQGAASFHTSVLSAKGCCILLVFILDIIAVSLLQQSSC
jgi:hypothetical protein